MNLFTYGHSILGIALALGVFFLPQRMNANQTVDADAMADEVTDRDLYNRRGWQYKVLTRRDFRYSIVGFLLLSNLFLVVMPFIPTKHPDGQPRRIPTWILPAAVLPVYAAGALAGLTAVIICSEMTFWNTLVELGEGNPRRRRLEWVAPESRRWKLLYPEVRASR